MKCAPTVGRDPDVFGGPARDCGDRSRRRIRTYRFKLIALIGERIRLSSAARARPQPALRIRFQSVDENAPPPAYYVFSLAIFFQDESATLRSGVELLAYQRAARN